MRYLILLLAIFCVPMLSFKDVPKQELIIGRWKMDVIKAFPGNSKDEAPDLLRKMEGDELTFFRDNSVKYFKKSTGATSNGIWKITKGERGQIKAATTASNQENDPAMEHFNVLEITLGSGKKTFKITGEDLSITAQKLYYSEARSGNKYWYFWLKLANEDARGN